MTTHIAMWSGPRNLSTALMYSFAARGDCAVEDEPFYGAYLAQTGIDHPMRDAVMSSQPADHMDVAADCIGPIPGGQPLFYQKHMTLHMLPDWNLIFMQHVTNVFLIRHPARVVASYAKKREAPTLADIGFAQQARLFDEVAGFLGHPPPVIDSVDIRANPAKALNRLCTALNIPYTARMLHWDRGPKAYDGIWAPHWYNAVHASTGFEKPEGPLPALKESFADLADQAMPHYQHLRAFLL